MKNILEAREAPDVGVTVHQFGYNDNTIRMQRYVVPVTGILGVLIKANGVVSWSVLDETQLPKWMKQS